MATVFTPGGYERQQRTAQALGALPMFTPGGAARQAATAAVVKPAAELVGDVLFGPSAPPAPPARNTGGASGSWGAPARPAAVAPVPPTAAPPSAATPPRRTAPGFGADGGPVTISPNVTTIRGAEGQRVITNTGGRMTLPSMDQINNFGGYNMRTYGANFNPQTGKFDTPTGGAPAAPSVQDVVMRKIADIERDPAYQNQSVARLRAIEGLLGALSQGATQRDVANIGATTRGGVSPKDVAEAALLSDRLTAARGAKTPEERNALLTGSAPVSPSYAIPQGYMGDFTKDIPLVTTRGPGAGTVRITQPERAAFTPKDGDRVTVPNKKGERVPGTWLGGKFIPD